MKVLAVSEQAIVVCNVYMIHDMKPPDVSSFLKPKKIQSSTYWTQIEQKVKRYEILEGQVVM
jgi:hypothetical protein